MRSPAIVVLTHSREPYLRATLEALFRLQGIDQFTIYVSCDESPNREKLLQLAATVGVPPSNHWRATPPNSQYASAPLAKIAHHFRYVFTQAFNVHHHSHLILLEDDLVPAPDFLNLFLSTAYLLDADPTLWCVSAWNDNGLKSVSREEDAFYRTDYFPGLGWMLKAELWLGELASKWPESPSTGWDHWMRLSDQHKGRECIFPEVPRTQHIGVEGTNVHEAAGQSMADIYAFSTRGPRPFENMARLGQPAYENWMASQIKAAPRVSLGAAGPAMSGLVLYTTEDYYSLQTALGLRVDSPRGTYRGVITLRKPGGLLFLADVRVSKHIETREQVRPTPGLLFIPAAQGQSCDARCKQGRSGVVMHCAITQFAFLNTCDALKKVFPCEKGCGHQTGPDIPNYVPAPHQPTYQQCLISDGGPDCAASHPDTQRLCPCVV